MWKEMKVSNSFIVKIKELQKLNWLCELQRNFSDYRINMWKVKQIWITN